MIPPWPDTGSTEKVNWWPASASGNPLSSPALRETTRSGLWTSPVWNRQTAPRPPRLRDRRANDPLSSSRRKSQIRPHTLGVLGLFHADRDDRRKKSIFPQMKKRTDDEEKMAMSMRKMTLGLSTPRQLCFPCSLGSDHSLSAKKKQS